MSSHIKNGHLALKGQEVICCGIWDFQWVMGLVILSPVKVIIYTVLCLASFLFLFNFFIFIVMFHLVAGWIGSRLETLGTRIFFFSLMEKMNKEFTSRNRVLQNVCSSHRSVLHLSFVQISQC